MTFAAGDTDYIAKLNALVVGGGVPVTTKGDLVTYSTTVVRFPVGANGSILTANSAETTGLQWTATPTLTSLGVSGITLGVAAGRMLFTEIAQPGVAPASGTAYVWADSTSDTLKAYGGTGPTVSTTVIANTGAANNFLTAISAGGVVSRAQPDISNLSGFGTGNATALAVNVGSTGSFNPMTTAGDIIIGGASGSPTRLAAGSTSGHVLTSTGAGAAPSWQAASGGMTNPMTTGGDVIYGGASGTPTRLANGSAGEVLTSAGGTDAPTWEPAGGSTPAHVTAAAVHHNHLAFGAF